jgi:hypothetical protein
LVRQLIQKSHQEQTLVLHFDRNIGNMTSI